MRPWRLGMRALRRCMSSDRSRLFSSFWTPGSSRQLQTSRSPQLSRPASDWCGLGLACLREDERGCKLGEPLHERPAGYMLRMSCLDATVPVLRWLAPHPCPSSILTHRRDQALAARASPFGLVLVPALAIHYQAGPELGHSTPAKQKPPSLQGWALWCTQHQGLLRILESGPRTLEFRVSRIGPSHSPTRLTYMLGEADL